MCWVCCLNFCPIVCSLDTTSAMLLYHCCFQQGGDHAVFIKVARQNLPAEIHLRNLAYLPMLTGSLDICTVLCTVQGSVQVTLSGISTRIESLSHIERETLPRPQKVQFMSRTCLRQPSISGTPSGITRSCCITCVHALTESPRFLDTN